jgi:uncharacterized protein (DUF342 family)
MAITKSKTYTTHQLNRKVKQAKYRAKRRLAWAVLETAYAITNAADTKKKTVAKCTLMEQHMEECHKKVADIEQTLETTMKAASFMDKYYRNEVVLIKQRQENLREVEREFALKVKKKIVSAQEAIQKGLAIHVHAKKELEKRGSRGTIQNVRRSEEHLNIVVYNLNQACTQINYLENTLGNKDLCR